jgi:hypothetical protein
MAQPLQRPKLYVQVTELRRLAKALPATSITPETPRNPSK